MKSRSLGEVVAGEIAYGKGFDVVVKSFIEEVMKKAYEESYGEILKEHLAKSLALKQALIEDRKT